jgi:exopolyphosphatase/guanosine-5'-triphosphate,3'-diphosphate pyrophosphatase
MKSIAAVLISSGLCKDGIDHQGLQQLLDKAIDAGSLDALDLPGLSADRKPVFPGGLAILLGLFELFDIQEMRVSDIALREGVLYDLVGRSSAEDIRDVTVSAMLTRWALDPSHGEQVRDKALELFAQVSAAWDLRDQLFSKVLAWSAQLHELGLLIGHDGYQKHGAYLVANADMAGFARRDQLLLAALIEGHRGKFPLARYESLPSVLVTPAKRVAVILRLAVLLHRGRSSSDTAKLEIKAQGQHLKLCFKGNWLAQHPLTDADLKLERDRLNAIGIKLSYS